MVKKYRYPTEGIFFHNLRSFFICKAFLSIQKETQEAQRTETSNENKEIIAIKQKSIQEETMQIQL
ncbi:MAG: hypothetical protein ACUVWN_07285 [bacterium]